MLGPLSLYSLRVIHICWKVVRLARMEPPIHTLSPLPSDASTERAGEVVCQLLRCCAQGGTARGADVQVPVTGRPSGEASNRGGSAWRRWPCRRNGRT